MKITVNKVEIKPTIAHGKVRLKLDVDMEEHQKENLFYEIWEDVGDEGIEKYLNAEGFKMVKK
jgi:hypothetical protein